MDYNALVGDQISQQQVPLMSNGMPTAGPSGNVPTMPMPTYAELCQKIAMYEQANGPLTGARLQQAEYTMQRLGYPSVSKCNGNQSPFQNWESKSISKRDDSIRTPFLASLRRN
jgi:hypothetical protein